MSWALLLVLVCGGARSHAEEADVLPDAPSAVLKQQSEAAASSAVPQDETEEQRKERLRLQAESEMKKEEGQRILAVVPNFNTVENGQAAPLSNGQKARLAVRGAFDPFNFVGAVVLSGYSEVADEDGGYGWGPAGFGKRVGAHVADIVDGLMLSTAAYPILLHQDPRFFRKGTGTVRARVQHALLAAVICHGDNGKLQPNYSNVAGNISAGLVSNLYYPANETGVRLSLVNSSIGIVGGALGNVGLEFSPDIAQWWKRRRQK